MARANKQKAVVLVVEDEFLIRMDVVDNLTDAGFEVLDAKNADEAIRLLESRNDIELVFTDVHMPGSIDGIEGFGGHRSELSRHPGGLTISKVDCPTEGALFQSPTTLGVLAERSTK